MRRSFVLLLPLLGTLGCGIATPNVGETRAAESGDIACDQYGCISLSTFAAKIKDHIDGKVVGYGIKVGAQPTLTGGLAHTAADSPPSGLPMSTSRNIQIASISKLVTTVVALQAMNKAGLSLDESISKFLWPSWTQGPNINKITMRDLLTHRSGIYYPGTPHAIDPCDGGSGSFGKLKEIIAAGVNASDVGSSAHYSNCNFDLFREMLPFMMGYSYTGGDDDGQRGAWSMLIYEAWAREYVFTPLGFDGFCTGAPSEEILAYPFPAGSTKGTDFDFSPATCGGAGWYLSLDDLALFANDLANGNQTLTPLEKSEMVADLLGWDNSVGHCTDPSLCKNGQMVSDGAQVNTYLGIVKCNQPVVAVVNSPLPAPFDGNGAITDLVAKAMAEATLDEATAPATCCDGSKPCGGRGGQCCSWAQTCTASGTCVAVHPCEGVGYACSSASECCSGNCTNHTCSCVSAGGDCAHGGNCCNGYVCSAGTCKRPNVKTCNGEDRPTSGCSGTWTCCGTDGWTCGRCI